MMRKLLTASVGNAILLIVLGTALVVYAAQYYQVGSGSTVQVNEHGTCKNVKNNNGSSIFVPTNSSGEWSAFRDHAPNVQLTDCGGGSYYYYLVLGEYSDGPEHLSCTVNFSDGSSWTEDDAITGPPNYYGPHVTSANYGYFNCSGKEPFYPSPGDYYDRVVKCPSSNYYDSSCVTYQ